jgi:hypothetical protein
MNDSSQSDRSQTSATGIERACLRQAVHDLRNRLNATSLLVDTVRFAASRGAAEGASVERLGQAVQELRRCGRMLDHLAAAGDTFAADLEPVDLVGVLAGIAASSATSAVTARVDVGDEPGPEVWSCPTRLARMLGLVRERCAAALPEGGEVLFVARAVDGCVSLRVTATGPRLLAPEPGKVLDLVDGSVPGADWFALHALVRGIRGDLRVASDRNALELQIDLPRCAPPSGDGTAAVITPNSRVSPCWKH